MYPLKALARWMMCLQGTDVMPLWPIQKTASRRTRRRVSRTCVGSTTTLNDPVGGFINAAQQDGRQRPWLPAARAL
jgi:hypothetical protein